MKRRTFLMNTARLGAGALFLPALTSARAAQVQASPPTGKIRLGGPSFSSATDPEQLAQVHRKMGYAAAYCPDVRITDSDKLRSLESAFAKHNVVIAEVGRWCNLMDADPGQRRKNLENVIDGLAVADAVGALCCVDIAGSFNRDTWFGPHPKNFSQDFFDLAVENARKIVDAVKPRRAKLAYEMMGWAIPSTPQQYLDLIRAIDRPAFAVHLDPCNAINSPEKIYSNTALLNECFDRLGPWIVSCHAKDLAWRVEMNVHFLEVIPGKGVLDYETYLRRLADLPHAPPLMLEHLSNAEEYAQGCEHIRSVGARIGVAFA